MKKIITFALLFLLSMTRLSAQSNTGAVGGEATGSGGAASFTAGEVFYTYKTGASGSMTDGVQQGLNNSYTINFDANGGTGTMTAQTQESSTAANLTANAFTRTGYTFAGWATTSGGAVAYANSVSYTMGSADVTLYAKWTANNYTITFNSNEGSGNITPQTITYLASASLTANAFTRTGYTFAGWATTSGGAVAYANSVSYTMGSADVTLYAKWTANNYTITFNANGGSGNITPQTITYLASASLTANAFTRTGYTFAGWATTSGGAVAYANSVSYTMGAADVNLYALWTAIPLCPSSTALTPSGSQTICIGTNASQLTANITNTGLSGTPTYSYKWYYNSSNINIISSATEVSGATSSTFTPANTASEVGERWYFSVGYSTDNGCGQSATDQSLASNAVKVTVNALPTAGITNNTNKTELTCITTAISVTATGGTSYSWSGGATPTTAANSFTAAGTYTVTVTSANGCTDTKSITITADQTAPTAGITNNTNKTELTCITTAISVTATGGTSYSWSGGATPTTAANSFTAAGTYTVTVTSANGCTDTKSITITADQTAPTAGITNNTNKTELTCITTAISVTATGGTSYSWSGGATPTTAANSFTAAGTYTVTVTSANGCTDTKSITITADQTAPTAGITNNTNKTELTCITTAISVTATGGTSYSWSGGATPTTAANSFTAAGTYTVTVTSANGCIDTKSITITADQTAPTAGITNNTSTTALTCNTTAISVTATGGTSYSWSGGATPTTAANSFTAVGTYTVTVTSANGCTDTKSITITFNAPPVVASITGTTSVCVGSTTPLANATASGIWSTETPAVATVSATGVVTGISAGTSLIFYKVTNADGCVTSVSATVTVNALPVVTSITGTTSVCVGSTTALANATALGVWSSATPAVATVSTTGVVTAISAGTSVISYTLTVNGCSTTSSKTITVIALPSSPVVNAETYCELAVTNVLSATGSAGNTLSWFGTSATGGTATSVAPKPSSLTAGIFNFYVSQTNPSTGCESPRSKLSVTVYPTPVKATITRDATGTLVSNITNGNQWFWNGIIMIGDTFQKLKPVQSGPYSIILIQNGCWGPMSDSYYNLITAIPTLSNNEYVKVYPNPVQSILRIDFGLNRYTQVDLKLFDNTGKLITEKKKLLNGSKINLSGLVAGIYRYQLIGKDGKILFSDKFMKN